MCGFCNSSKKKIKKKSDVLKYFKYVLCICTDNITKIKCYFSVGLLKESTLS